MDKKCASYYRNKKRMKFEQDLEDYRWLNHKLKMYPDCNFEITDFASPEDPKPVGDRKEKNKISAKNSRTRRKRRDKELERRVKRLRREDDINYISAISEIAHELFIHKINTLPFIHEEI